MCVKLAWRIRFIPYVKGMFYNEAAELNSKLQTPGPLHTIEILNEFLLSVGMKTLMYV